MATYNGADYVEAMLQSLLNQSDSNFFLTIRDDKSTDRTPEIIRDYIPSFDGRLTLMDSDQGTGSAKGNFSKLLEMATGDHILFADQDDVWTEDHVAHLVDLMTEAESTLGLDKPIYAFSDVTPVDIDLNPLADSFFSFKGIDPSISQKLNKSIVCPPMLGCASCINQALLQLVRPVPVDLVTGHDWWALLLASAAGHCTWSNKSTVYYRQHGNNSSSQIASKVGNYARVNDKVSRVRRGMILRQKQAVAVRNRLAQKGLVENLHTLDRFDQLMRSGFVLRRVKLLVGGYLYPDLTRNLGMLALC